VCGRRRPRLLQDGRDAYVDAAGRYDLTIEPFARRMRLVGLAMLSPPPGISVLDVGCGTGAQLALYRRAGCRVFGVDASAAMLSVARAKLGPGAGLYLGDGSSLPFQDGHFDVVTATLVLHETAPQGRPAIVRQAARVTRPEGRLVLTDYHVGPPRWPTGWLAHLVARLVEASVGGEHYRNYRSFVAGGGLGPLIAEAGLAVEQERRVFLEAFSVNLLRRW
jgi:ubiquinone/menaquinone biosynthesis C-methylase UbiE